MASLAPHRAAASDICRQDVEPPPARSAGVWVTSALRQAIVDLARSEVRIRQDGEPTIEITVRSRA
jgi:hypothetical protein